MCGRAGEGKPPAWGTARVGNTSQNLRGRQAGVWGGSEGQVPALLSLQLLLAALSLPAGSAQTLLCSPAPAASAVVGTATSTPSTFQTLLQHGDSHQDTATLPPRKLHPSPALPLQRQPFDPRCSNAAEDAFLHRPSGCLSSKPTANLREKSHRKSRRSVSSVRTVRNQGCIPTSP